MAATASFIAAPKTPVAAFVNGDGTGFKTLMTGGSLGSRVDSLIATTTDASNASIVQLAIQVSSVDYVLGEVSVPAGSGTNGTAKSVALLNPTDIPGLAYTEGGAVFLAAGSLLRARVKTAVAGANTLQIVGAAGDY
jgi:hypothetical protein